MVKKTNTANLVLRSENQKIPRFSNLRYIVGGKAIMSSEAAATTDTTQKFQFNKEWLWVLLPIGVYFLLITLFTCWTLEDAYIMLRYAVNIANGYGIVYNPGGTPVWGCTSLLTTLVLAGSISIGIPPLTASYVLGITLGVSLFLVVYVIERRILGISNYAAIASLLVLAVSHIVSLSLMGYDAPLFAFTIAILFGISVKILQDSQDMDIGKYHLFLVIIAILVSITRPEGAIVAIITFAFIIWFRRNGSRLTLFLATVLPYGVVMGAFYLWATLYFGAPLPNPFYIKTGLVPIYPLSILYTALFFLLYFGMVRMFYKAYRSACGSPQPTCQKFRTLVFAALPAFTYIIIYLAVDQTFNHEMRFQFPFVPILVMLFAQAVHYFQEDLPRDYKQLSSISFKDPKKKSLTILLIVALALPLIRIPLMLPFGEHPGPIGVGLALHNYHDKGYTMLMSEAGRMPFYADWHTIDSYGLNDPYIAHNGLTDAYIAANNPEIIMFNSLIHYQYTPEWEIDPSPWEQMCLHMYKYAMDNNYTLACKYIVYLRINILYIPIGFQWFFVRPDFADSAAIINDLQSVEELHYIYPLP